MSRLVDIDELKHELKWLEEYDLPVYHDVVSTIDEMPTVDAEPVVRCADGEKGEKMRLIDADALKQTFCAECDHSIKCEDCDIDYHFEHLAPAIDAVEVVRCEDCKFHLDSNEKCGLVDTRLHFYETDKVWTEDCFCAWGERREDETD